MPDRPPDPQTPVVERVLLDLGLPEVEVETYQYLLSAENATPSEVALRTHQSRSQAYKTLRELAQRGLVLEIPTKPIRYTAVPLTQLVAIAASQISQQTKALREMQAWVQRSGPSPVAMPDRPIRAGDAHVVTGRGPANDLLGQLVRDARESVLVAGGRNLAARLEPAAPVRGEIRQAAARGAAVQVLVAADGDTLRRLEVLFADAPAGVSITGAPPGFDTPLAVAVSEASTVFILAQPENDDPRRGEDFAFRVQGVPFARAYRARLEASLPLAKT